MIFLILILGLFLRVISLNQSLWLDEAINVLAVKNNSLWDLITVYTKADFHPPGYFILLWLWVHLFNNYSEVWVRVPSVIAGVITIYFTYLLGKEIKNKKIGLLTAFLLAMNPLHIYYSQEARMYSLAALGVVVNFLMFIKFIKEKKGSFVGYLVTLPLVFLFDYLAYFIFPVQFVWIFLGSKKLIRKWVISIIPAIVFLLIWGLVFVPQFLTGIKASSDIKGWSEVVGGADIKKLALVPIKFSIGRISYPDKYIYTSLLIPILGLISFIFYKAFNDFKYKDRIRWVSLFLITLLVPLIISFKVPIFSYFRLLYLVPFFCLILAIGISTFRNWKVVLILVSSIFIISSLIYLINPQFQREDWRGLAKSIPSDTLIESTGLFAPMEYYLSINSASGIGKTSKATPALKVIPAKIEQDLISIDGVLKNKKKIYYLEYLTEITDPQRLLQKKLELLGYRKVGVKNFNGVGFLYEYSK